MLTGDWEQRLADRARRGLAQAVHGDIAKFAGATVRELDAKLKDVRIPRATLGPCPVCGRDISENRKGYSCWARDDPGCGFVIWKSKAGKTLPCGRQGADRDRTDQARHRLQGPLGQSFRARSRSSRARRALARRVRRAVGQGGRQAARGRGAGARRGRRRPRPPPSDAPVPASAALRPAADHVSASSRGSARRPNDDQPPVARDGAASPAVGADRRASRWSRGTRSPPARPGSRPRSSWSARDSSDGGMDAARDGRSGRDSRRRRSSCSTRAIAPRPRSSGRRSPIMFLRFATPASGRHPRAGGPVRRRRPLAGRGSQARRRPPGSRRRRGGEDNAGRARGGARTRRCGWSTSPGPRRAAAAMHAEATRRQRPLAARLELLAQRSRARSFALASSMTSRSRPAAVPVEEVLETDRVDRVGMGAQLRQHSERSTRRPTFFTRSSTAVLGVE